MVDVRDVFYAGVGRESAHAADHLGYEIKRGVIDRGVTDEQVLDCGDDGLGLVAVLVGTTAERGGDREVAIGQARGIDPGACRECAGLELGPDGPSGRFEQAAVAPGRDSPDP